MAANTIQSPQQACTSRYSVRALWSVLAAGPAQPNTEPGSQWLWRAAAFAIESPIAQGLEIGQGGHVRLFVNYRRRPQEPVLLAACACACLRLCLCLPPVLVLVPAPVVLHSMHVVIGNSRRASRIGKPMAKFDPCSSVSRHLELLSRRPTQFNATGPWPWPGCSLAHGVVHHRNGMPENLTHGATAGTVPVRWPSKRVWLAESACM